MDESAFRIRTTKSRRIMAALALSLMLATMGTSIANVALPTLAEAFAAPFHAVRWVVISYLVAMTVSVVIAGMLGDIYGLRRMLVVGLVVYSVASLVCGIVPTLWLLIAARAVQGIAAAFLMTLSLALAREVAGEAGTGRAMGLLGTVSAIGTALGPSLGGVLLATMGWPGIFLVQVPFAVLALVLVGTWRTGATAGPVARPGRFVLAGVAVLLPGLLVNLLVAAVMMTTLLIGPFYLRLGLGLSDLAVGLTMTVGPALAILGGIPAGRAVDAWGAARVVTAGLKLLAAGAFALVLLPGRFGLGGYVLAVAVLTPGYQLFQAANNTAVLATVSKERRGVAAGLLGLSRNLGLVLGASAMGAVFAFGVGTGDFRQAGPVEITNGLQMVFGVAGVMMLVALAIAVNAIRVGPPVSQPDGKKVAGTAAAVEA